MKKIKYLSFLLVFIFALVACHSTKKTADFFRNAQGEKLMNFEGKIIYDLVMKDKTGSMMPEQVKMFIGTEQVNTLKGNKYKNEMNGSLKMTQIFLGQDTLYHKMEGNNNLLWLEISSNPDELIDYNIQRQVETIAGIKCDLLTINSVNGVTKYYFSDKYYVNPDNYKDHVYGFWNLCLEQTKSFPIKSIVDTKELYLEVTVKEIKEIKVEDSEFQLPNLPRVKSPTQ